MERISGSAVLNSKLKSTNRIIAYPTPPPPSPHTVVVEVAGKLCHYPLTCVSDRQTVRVTEDYLFCSSGGSTPGVQGFHKDGCQGYWSVVLQTFNAGVLGDWHDCCLFETGVNFTDLQ